MNFRNLLFVIFLSLNFDIVISQCNPAPNSNCDSDNYFCSLSILNGYTCTTSPIYDYNFDCGGAGCSETQKSNAGWWKFMTNGGNITITVSYSSCTNSHGFSPSGIHFGIIESCSCFRPIICHSSCSGTSGTYTYSATLKACTVYSFWIGGCNGDVCNYSISVTGGGAPQLDPLVITESSPSPLCSTCCSEFSVNTQALCNVQYEWTLDGEIIPGARSPKATICYPEAKTFTVCCEAKIDLYEIVECNSRIKCKSVTVMDLPDARAKDINLCNYQLPYRWQCQTIKSSGEYSCEFSKSCCKYDSVIYFNVFSDDDQYCLESQYVTGVVYLDRNKNSIFETNEPIVENQIISSEPLGIITNSKTTGYSIFVRNLSTNTVKLENLQPNRWNIIPSEHQISVGTQIGKQRGEYNFALQLLQEKDLAVAVSAGIARAGRRNAITILIENKAEDVDNYIVDLEMPSSWTFKSATEKPSGINANRIEWKINTKLKAFEKKLITVMVDIPASAKVGDQFEYKASVNLTSDEDTSNDQATWKGVIVASFDPNDKHVAVKGYSYNTNKNGDLLYTIRFMNTGSDTAFSVLIKDTLSRYLDPNTIRIVHSSHPVKLTMNNLNVANFYFDQIILPDSSINFIASQGFVQFLAKPNAKFNLDVEIPNRASIYFDHNAPVGTNTAVFREYYITSTKEETSTSYIVFPNPVNEKLHLFSNGKNQLEYDELKITSVFGQSHSLSYIKSQHIIDISKLPNAIYFIELFYKGQSIGRKNFVKQ
ncbi:MAG: T9SS type A sorting domain-containing protein [Saprospiraceae bacterium]